jgi:hypothetical protein
MTPALFFLLNIALVILVGGECLHINLRLLFSGSVNNVIRILVGIKLNL